MQGSGQGPRELCRNIGGSDEISAGETSPGPLFLMRFRTKMLVLRRLAAMTLRHVVVAEGLLDLNRGKTWTAHGQLRKETAKSDIYAFFFDQKGLMAGIGIQGSKITKIEK
jgi:lipid-binding SYLF domain-containing protein